MSDAQNGTSDAARQLSHARWGNQVVSRAFRVVLDRRGELDAQQLAELAAVLGQEEADGA